MENKFINRYNTFCRCLENLKKSQKADPEADFVLEETVQNFKVHPVPVRSVGKVNSSSSRS